MKIIVLCLCLAGLPAGAKSLDAARELASRLEGRLPHPVSPVLCTTCDDEWIVGGEPLRRLELVLSNALADPRSSALATHEHLGALLAEHLTLLATTTAPVEKNAVGDGKATLCALSRPPSQLFAPGIFTDFCAPADTP